MSNVEFDHLIAALKQIRSLANQEALFIERKEIDEMWTLREARNNLTLFVNEHCERTTAKGHFGMDQVADLSLLVHAIQEMDSKNLDRLTELKRRSAEQLGRLYEGKQALHGYRAASGQSPVYIDRRG